MKPIGALAAEPPADAKILIESGQYNDARALLDQRLAANSHDVEALFLAGMLALRQDRLKDAIYSFRKALDLQPKATRIRLELARALYRARRDEESDYHFRLAIADHPPAPVLATIVRFRESLRARRAWRFNLNFAIAPDSNINAASNTSRIDVLGIPFRLDPSARARSGVGWIVAGDASLRLRRDSRLPIFLAAYGRSVRYRDARFNDTYVGGEAGPEVALSGGRLRLGITGVRRWFGGHPLLTSVGGRLHFDKIVAGKLGVEASLAARHFNYARRTDFDGWEYEATGAVNRAFSSTALGYASITTQRTVDKSPAESNWRIGLRLGIQKEIGWGLRPQLSLDVEKQVNDAQSPLFGLRRHDWGIEASGSLYKRDWNVAGFAPSLKLSWARNQSTIALYDQKRFRLEGGIEKAF
ncbi:MAG: surface lipoprotein assembly modifier [Sphingomicrobium sp.]